MKRGNKPGVVVIEGHIQGLSNTRALGEAGIPVYVVDSNDCIAHYSRYCLKFFKCPDFNNDLFADFLLDLALKEGLKNWLLLPSNDHAVVTISQNTEKLNPYYKIITPPYEILKNIINKAELLKIAESLNISIPNTFFFSKHTDFSKKELPYPLLTKGVNGLSFYRTFRKKVFVSNNKTELEKNLKIISIKIPVEDTFTQEIIPPGADVKTVSFTAFCVEGEIKTYWTGEKIREHPFQFGTATFCRSLMVEEIYDPSARLIKTLGYSGICEIEYLKDPRDNTFRLIEINPRTWLWVGLAKAAGVNYVKIIYDYINKHYIDYPQNYDTGIRWSNRFTDLAYSLPAVIMGKIKLPELLKSYRGKMVYAIYDKTDLKPVLFYLLFLINFLRKR